MSNSTNRRAKFMKPVYLDHAATTPVRKEVRAAMEPYGLGAFGNASSTHRWGQVARAALENARAEIAESLGAQPSEIRFIRGGTESDNLALIGSYRAQREASDGGTPSVVVTTVEHSAVLEAAAYLETSEGANLTTLPVSPDGTVDISALEAVIAHGPATVSMMWVNNETGIILPVGEVTQKAHSRGALMHTDACQALGKVRVHVGDVSCDLLTATAHKINGPKGMALLFVREGTSLHPLIHGGSQERALRPGTEDIAGAVGLATAVRLAVEEQAENAFRLKGIRDNLEEGLRGTIPGLRINCAEAERACHVSSLGIPNVSDAPGLLMALDLQGIAVSGGSACHSGSGKGSHVIGALYGEDDPMATVRVSFGLGTNEADLKRVLEVLPRVVTRLTAKGAVTL